MNIFFLVFAEANKEVEVPVGALGIIDAKILFLADDNRCRGGPDSEFKTIIQRHKRSFSIRNI